METEFIRRNLCQIDKNKVFKYVHDMDNKTGYLMNKSANTIEEKINPNRTLYSTKDYEVSALRYLTDIQYKKKFFGLKKHV